MIEIERDQDAGETAVARQSALPNHGNFPRVRQEIVRLIKQNMSEPRADNRPEHQIQTERGQIFEIPVFPAVKLRHDLKAEEKSEGEEKPVPADFDWAENENCRIYVPNEMAHLRSHSIIFRRLSEFQAAINRRAFSASEALL